MCEACSTYCTHCLLERAYGVMEQELGSFHFRPLPSPTSLLQEQDNSLLHMAVFWGVMVRKGLWSCIYSWQATESNVQCHHPGKIRVCLHGRVSTDYSLCIASNSSPIHTQKLLTQV